jgi:hypothetical protein
MQFDDRTLLILKNFNTINQSILIKPGNFITTMSANKSMLATAKVTESFEKQFAIYDLSRFLGVFSLFDKPELVINEKFATIKSGSKRVNYTFADPETIPVPKSSSIDLEDVVVEFEMTAAMLKDIKKASDILGLPEIAIVADAGSLKVKTFDSQNPTGDTYDINISEIEQEFSFIFKTENLKFLEQDYNVKVDSRGIAQFTGVDIQYWVPVEHNSKKK